MSYFGENYKIQKTTVITYFGTKYTTAKGLTSMLSDDISRRIMNLELIRKNKSKYGEPTYSKPAAVKLWKEQRSRLRKKAYRRIFPIIQKLWE